MAKIETPPPRDACMCTSFCLEDLSRTGRYCKHKYRKYYEQTAKPERTVALTAGHRPTADAERSMSDKYRSGE